MKRSFGVALLLALVLSLSSAIAISSEASEEIVAFNVESKKYHCLECQWAIRCTKNCIEVAISEARRRVEWPARFVEAHAAEQ